MKFVVANLIADTPNSNGRVYSKELMQQMMDQINGKEMYITRAPSVNGNVDLSNIVGKITHAELKDGRLEVEARLLNTPAGKDLPLVFDIVPQGIGSVDGDNIVDKDYKLVGFPIKEPDKK